MPPRLQSPFTYLITPGTLTDNSFEESSGALLEQIERAASIGVSAIQIREKSLSAGRLLELAKRAVDLLAPSRTAVFVNERVDIAISSGAAGVHLTSTGMPVSVVRDITPETFLIGVSTHTLEEVGIADRSGADLILFGPVFETPGKKTMPVDQALKALELAADIAENSLLVGIGGIDGSNFREVLETGADGFAAIRMFLDQETTESVIDTIRKTRTG